MTYNKNVGICNPECIPSLYCGGDVRLLSSPFRRQIASAIIFIAISLSVTACGSDPYQPGMNQFDSQAFAHIGNHQQIRPTSDWTVYVGHGMVTKGWLWFKHQTPVVYAQIDNTGAYDAADVVIQFGDKKIKSPMQGQDSDVGFYIDSSQIPQHVDISWKVNGQPHHEIIDSKSISNWIYYPKIPHHLES